MGRKWNIPQLKSPNFCSGVLDLGPEETRAPARHKMHRLGDVWLGELRGDGLLPVVDLGIGDNQLLGGNDLGHEDGKNIYDQ